MVITHKINMDFGHRGVTPRIDVVQDDKYSRNLQICLYENDARWEIPIDAVAVVRYQKSDGTGGKYDTLPDGTLAYDISGNVLTVALAPQVCTAPGLVDFAVCLIQAESEITTFAVNIIVQPVPGADIASEEYENLTLRFFFVTQAEYDALPEEEKLAGTYFITDADDGTDTSLSIAGRAADALVVGERFGKLDTALEAVKEAASAAAEQAGAASSQAESASATASAASEKADALEQRLDQLESSVNTGLTELDTLIGGE